MEGGPGNGQSGEARRKLHAHCLGMRPNHVRTPGGKPDKVDSQDVA